VPLKAVLRDTNLTAADLDALEIIGGATRVPRLQAALLEYLVRSVQERVTGMQSRPRRLVLLPLFLPTPFFCRLGATTPSYRASSHVAGLSHSRCIVRK
jgi:hypothetical protein